MNDFGSGEKMGDYSIIPVLQSYNHAIEKFTTFTLARGPSTFPLDGSGQTSFQMELMCNACSGMTMVVILNAMPVNPPKIDFARRTCDVSLGFSGSYGNCNHCHRIFVTDDVDQRDKTIELLKKRYDAEIELLQNEIYRLRKRPLPTEEPAAQPLEKEQGN